MNLYFILRAIDGSWAKPKVWFVNTRENQWDIPATIRALCAQRGDIAVEDLAFWASGAFHMLCQGNVDAGKPYLTAQFPPGGWEVICGEGRCNEGMN